MEGKTFRLSDASEDHGTNYTVRTMMKNTIVCLGMIACVCLVSTSLIAQVDSHNQTDGDEPMMEQREILRLEEFGRQKAIQGEKVWDDLMADGAYMIRWDGTTLVYQKGQELPTVPLRSFTLSDLIVRVYGEVAVVTALAAVECDAQGKPFSYNYRYMNVWKKLDAGWKIVVTGGTVVKQAAQ